MILSLCVSRQQYGGIRHAALVGRIECSCAATDVSHCGPGECFSTGMSFAYGV